MTKQSVSLGLSKNWRQFSLLILINAFVGGMVGMERTIFPQFAGTYFGIESKTAILSFIVAFGITKAAANYYAGKLANRYGRRAILLSGWFVAIPVPLILLFAPSWSWVVFANVLLGISQGLTWSSTVVMKIDLVGSKNRGLAMGLNEFSGYLAVGLVAFLSGYLAAEYGIKPYPFYLGFGLALAGTLLTLFAKDTQAHMKSEDQTAQGNELKHVFRDTTFSDKALSSVTQAGMVNNLNDGMIWGLLPMLLIAYGFGEARIGILTAIYPAVWGIGQLFTGKMADHFPHKEMLFWGMLAQAAAIFTLPFTENYVLLLSLLVLLGLGTALVYPTFLTAIASRIKASQRAESIGVFRLWRDLGYAIGALLSGILADAFNLSFAIVFIALLTFFSALIIRFRMP